ncbi:MAG: exonuclease SbcCD subunit D [Candidatus Nanoarchaeia archaeon]|nr:exonuclease SbcCD subunit D [Candidatus Nanoarchaeia archaeon]
MRFVHLADCHLDGYREEKLNLMSLDNFKYIVDFGIDKKVDFILLAGDLFNSALPKIDVLKDVATELKKLKDVDIPVYFIPGSHDFSPNGKTMLDVLESAGLMINVFKGNITPSGSLMLNWTVDEKTKAHITGIHGLKGMLDKESYEKLDYSNLHSSEFKIFMFHTAIKEMMPKDLEMMEAYSMDILPPGFDYYAGGHVHVRSQKRRMQLDCNEKAETESLNSEKLHAINNNVIYPGPTFPNNFSELQKLKKGSFIYYEDGKIDLIEIPNKEVQYLEIDCNSKTPSSVEENFELLLEKVELKNKIVLLRFFGTLSEGKTTEINFKKLVKACMDLGAHIVLKNTNKLESKKIDDIVITEDSVEDIELNTIDSNLDKSKLPEGFDEKEFILELIRLLETEQYDGEKKSTFEERLINDVKRLIKK